MADYKAPLRDMRFVLNEVFEISKLWGELPGLAEIVDEDTAAAILEEAGKDPVPGSYRLEVSSPGIDRPLTRLKDYGNWLGHEARLVPTEAAQGRKQLTGELLSLEGEMISVNDKKVGHVTVPFGQVLSAKLMLTNKLIAATRLLDTSGVDDIEEIDENADLEEQED